MILFSYSISLCLATCDSYFLRLLRLLIIGSFMQIKLLESTVHIGICIYDFLIQSTSCNVWFILLTTLDFYQLVPHNWKLHGSTVFICICIYYFLMPSPLCLAACESCLLLFKTVQYLFACILQTDRDNCFHLYLTCAIMSFICHFSRRLINLLSVYSSRVIMASNLCSHTF